MCIPPPCHGGACGFTPAYCRLWQCSLGKNPAAPVHRPSAGLFGWALIASARHFFASSALIGPAVFERSGGAGSARTAGGGRSKTTSIARSAVLVECILLGPQAGPLAP